jgi:hypothetical protein
MTGKKYILTSELFNGSIIFKFSLKGYLSEVKFEGITKMSMIIFDWLWANLPTKIETMENYRKRAENFTITEVPEDLSFARFWTEYGQKVGKKTMTETAWKKLSQKDKVAALLYIARLRNQKKLDGTQMPYPSTYLNQKYWEV